MMIIFFKLLKNINNILLLEILIFNSSEQYKYKLYIYRKIVQIIIDLKEKYAFRMRKSTLNNINTNNNNNIEIIKSYKVDKYNNVKIIILTFSLN